jgi:hypothetical protein
MIKRFIAAVVAVSMIASPAYAGKFGGGSSYRSSSFSSGSTYRSSSFSSGSSYRPSTSSRPTAPAVQSQPRFTTGSSYNYKPTQTRVVQRPVYNTPSYGGGYSSTPVVQNHYYGGGGGFGYGTFNSPWFWMWMMDRNHPQQPVVVQGGGYAAAPVQQGGVAPMMQGDPSQMQAAQQGPGFFSMIFWGLFNLIVLILVVGVIFWLGRKIYRAFKN